MRKNRSKCFVVLGAVLLLSGCGEGQMPSWLWGHNGQMTSSPPAQPTALAPRPAIDLAQEAVPPPQPVPVYAVTTGADGDPRGKASVRCGKLHRYAKLRQTQINPGTKPGSDTITWTFDCVY